MTRKRILKTVAVAIVAVIIALALAAYFALRGAAFHRYVLAALVRRGEQATGAKVEIGDFTFHLSGLRLDLYRITIHGTEPRAAQPLCSIDRTVLDLRIVSVLERRVEFRAVELDRPLVHLLVNADGQSNLPHPSATGSNPLNPFRLGVGRLTLRRGELDLNDRKIPVAAVLSQVRADASLRKTEYTGSLDYRDGKVHFGRFSTLRHSLELRFSADQNALRADPLVVRTAASRITIRATVENYNRPSARGSYSAELSTVEAGRVLNTGVIPRGIVSTEGAFEYRWAAGRALLDSLSLDGHFRSARLESRVVSPLGEMRAALSSARGSYTLAAGTFRGNNLEGNVLGGQARGNVVVRNLGAHPNWTLSGSLRALSLSDIRAALPGNRLARLPIDGSASGSVQAFSQGNRLSVQSDATLEATLPPAPGRRALSLDGAMHLAYDGQTRTLSLANTVFRTRASEVDLDGSIGSSLEIVARTSDLGDVDALVADVRARTGSGSVRVARLELSGSATFNGALQGPMQSLQLRGQLAADNLAVRKAVFPHLQTGVAVSASRIELTQGELRAAHGSARFQASLGLRNWTYDKSSPIALEVTAHGMSVAALESVAGKNYPVNGILSANIAVHGSLLHPAGHGEVEIAKAEAWDQPIQEVTLRLTASGNTVDSSAVIQARAGSATVHVTYNPASEVYDGAINLKGVRLEWIHALERARLPISGVLTASVRGQGTLKTPSAQATLDVPTLRIGKQTITAVSAKVTVAKQIATLALSSSFSGAPASAEGTVRLTGDYAANVNFHSGTIDAGPLIESYLPGGARGLQCPLEVEGWLRGPLQDRKKLTAHVEIPVLHLARDTIQVSSAAPITADYQGGVLKVHPAELKGSSTDFHVEATVPVAAGAPLDASLNGTIDFQLLQILDPDWATSGRVEVHLAARGSRVHPEIEGQMQFVNAAITPVSGPIGVQNLNAAVRITHGRAEVTRLTAEAGGGSITATGSVAYTRGVVFGIAIQANHVRVRYPQGVREVLDGNLRFSGTLESALISGQISIGELSLTPAFDLSTFANQFSVVSIPSGEATRFASRTRLNVGLRSSRELSLASSGIHLRGSANMRIEGTLADPVIIGRATLNGGDIVYGGRSYGVETGVVDFVNPVVTQPVVNISLVTTVDQYTLRLNFIGPFDQLRTTYSSDPPLAPADVLNLLVSGHPAATHGVGVGASIIQGIASQSPLNGRVQKLTGISSLTLAPQVGGYGTNPGAQIAVQQQVTRKLFLMFSVDVTTTQDDLIQLEYRLSHRWSVEAARNQDGGYSLEIRSRKTF